MTDWVKVWRKYKIYPTKATMVDSISESLEVALSGLFPCGADTIARLWTRLIEKGVIKKCQERSD